MIKNIEQSTELFVETTQLIDNSSDFYTDVRYKKQSFAIKGEAEALALAVKENADWFQTYAVTTITLDGKRFRGERENFSGLSYLIYGKILSNEDVLNSVPANVRSYAAYKEYKAESARKASYIRFPGYSGSEFLMLDDTMKVFSKGGGALLWPKAPVRGAAARPTADGNTL